MSQLDRPSLAAIHFLSRQCGLAPRRERRRWIEISQEMAGEATTTCPFEFVLSLTAGKPPRFGYLTAGGVGSSLDETIHSNLSRAIEICLRSGGRREDAELLTNIVELAYPDREELAFFSPAASAVLWGFVPTYEKLAIKVYACTRLASSSHRERVAAIMNRAGVRRDEMVLACLGELCEANSNASFRGVGVDLGGNAGGRARTKMYVRVAGEDLADRVSVLSRLLVKLDPRFDPGEFPARLETLVSTLGENLADQVELAVAFETRRPPSLKVTAFLVPGHEWSVGLAATGKTLHALGEDPGPVFELCEAIGAASDPPTPCSPVHGIGIESGVPGMSKVNIYVQPV